jgi:hypothetical protein
MEMQQMMERLLAKMDANQAERKADQEILARTEANRESDREQVDANLKDLKEDITSRQAEMRSIVNAWITDITDARKKLIGCQEVTGANSEKLEQIQEQRRP